MHSKTQNKVQLRTIEIKGFKSFADKTVIHFNEDMTGIVGPNGCGKSNTVDAIRWVLGEQKSRALRLEKMENVIFNGTKQRKASGKAEVSLTFENTRNLLPTEFHTVTVTRILYRTGDSEYRLNNVRCRLKDISNLFMDTGISSDSYAIIELGMIDDILKDKENSRRRLFEQAAGISKYKVRKRQTFNKLKATDADLDRVEDLLFEIETNLKTLEKQARRTQRYYKIKDQYKELSVELALYQLEGFKASFEKLNKQQEQENDKKIAIEALIANSEAALAGKKTEVIAKEKLLAAKQKELNDHIAYLRDEENRKNLMSENIKYLREKKDNLTHNITNAHELIGSLQLEITNLQTDKTNEEQVLKQLVTYLDDLKKSADSVRGRHDKLRQQLQAYRQTYREIERTIFETEKKIAVKTSQRESYINEIQTNKIRFQSRKSEVDDLVENLGKTEEERKNAESQLAHFISEEEQLKKQLVDKEEDIEKTRQELTDLNRQLDANRNEFNLTKSLIDNLEGFPDSVKYLKTSGEWNKEAPLLLDLINCDQEWRAAVENYLKPYLNNYVVNSVEQALSAAHLLDKAQKGKANFFILNGLNGKHSQKSAGIEGATSAISIINADDEFQPLMAHLLHDVYIVDNEVEIQDNWLKNGTTFITKNGKFIRKKGQLTGGSAGAYEGKRIGQRQQIKDLQKQIKQLETKTAKLHKGITNKQIELHKLKSSLKSKENWINHQHKVVNDLNNRIIQRRIHLVEDAKGSRFE